MHKTDTINLNLPLLPQMVPKMGDGVGTQTTLAFAGLQARTEWQPPHHLASSRLLLREGSKDEQLENSIHPNRTVAPVAGLP